MTQPAPRGPQIQVAPVHFEDFSGEQFERLAFTYVLRMPTLHSVEWTGQSGRDGGKDILAKDPSGDDHLFFCANYRRLTFEKVHSDVAKIVVRRPAKLKYVTLIAGAKVSDELRKKAKTEIADKLQVSDSEVWSGPEFEERLRLRGQDLLRRFVNGEPFPEQPEALRALATSSVKDAIQVDAQKLAAIDPRWDVKLDVLNSAHHYTLLPKEDIPTELKVSGPNVAKMKEHFEYGKPVLLDGTAVALEGSPIFDHLIKEKGQLASLAITPAKPFKVEFHFWTEGAEGFRFTVPGEITGGQIGLSFVSQLASGAPLRIEMKIPKTEVNAAKGEGALTIAFAFEQWANKTLTSLSYFDKVRGFTRAIVRNHRIHQEVTLDGNRVTGGTLGIPPNAEPFEYAAAVVENLAHAREIATRLGVKVTVPNLNDLAHEAFEEVDFVYSILFGGTATRTGAGFKVGLTIHGNGRPAEALAMTEQACSQGPFVLTKKNQEMSLYGTSISIGDVTYSVNRVRLRVPDPEHTQFLAGKIDTVNGIIEGLPDSEMVITTAPAP